MWHVAAPQFLSEVEAWCKVCSEGGLPSEMQELELAIHRHQSLYEQVTQAYTEVRPVAERQLNKKSDAILVHFMFYTNVFMKFFELSPYDPVLSFDFCCFESLGHVTWKQWL